MRNLLFWRQILGSIEPEWFKATAEREKPIGLFALLRRLTSKDSFRGLPTAADFLRAFGRHLHSTENLLPCN